MPFDLNDIYGGVYGVARQDANTPLVERRHEEWIEWRTEWAWLYDSWEGGDRYRNAVYGIDYRGSLMRNLVRHKREYPLPSDNPAASSPYGGVVAPPGSDPTYFATDDDFELRRARTPVPSMVEEAIEQHLGKIYEQEVDRQGPQPYLDWIADVDGSGEQIDGWMADTIAPMLMALGCLDLVFDHPRAPDGETVRSGADEIRLGLKRVVASYILPQNMLWWRTDDLTGRYVETLSLEYGEGGKAGWRYRHWTADAWELLDAKGNKIAGDTHPYRRVPIVRVFDRRLPRCCNVGKPRYQAIAGIQREYYNRDSELILSDTYQAHPLTQCPDDYIAEGATMPIGPGYVLPMKKYTSGSTVGYQGFEIIGYPNTGSESLRQNKSDLRDAADRAAHLTKPAGAAGTTGRSVGQSGVSKRLDQQQGNALLARIAKTLAAAEKTMAEFVLLVAANGQDVTASLDTIKVVYPQSFDLFSPDELAGLLSAFQDALANAGRAPEAETRILCQLMRQMLPGLEDEDYRTLDLEIKAEVERKAATSDQAIEAGGILPPPPLPPPAPPVNDPYAKATASYAAGAAGLQHQGKH